MDRQSRAKRIADLHVFYGQNEVVEELIRAGKIDEEYMYPFVDMDGEVFEWWLVSPYLAQELKGRGGRNRRARLSLVGTNNQRTGNLHGRRDTEDCRRVKLGLHIDIVKLQITEIRGIAIPRRFCNL